MPEPARSSWSTIGVPVQRTLWNTEIDWFAVSQPYSTRIASTGSTADARLAGT